MLPNPYLILGSLIAVLILVTGAFFEGKHYQTLQDAQALSDAKSQVILQMGKSEVITADVGKTDAVAQAQIQTVTQTIIKEVPVYVTKKSNDRCTIPNGFVQLHDAAASGVSPIPDATSGADDPASGVDLSKVASTVASNYGTCNQVRQSLSDLQQWVADQAKLK